MTTKYADIHIKVNPEVKEQSEEILQQIGISMSDLINMTLRRVIYERDIPFNTSVGLPSDLTINTKEEMLELLNSIEPQDESNLLSTEELLSGIKEHHQNLMEERVKREKVSNQIYA